MPKKINDLELDRKLNTALRYAVYTCVIGANNKIEDFEKSGGWVLNMAYRYGDGGEYLKDHSQYSFVDKSANIVFDSQSQAIIHPKRQWFYHPHHEDINKRSTHPYVREGIDPLTAPLTEKNMSACNIDETHLQYVFHLSLLAHETRMENCVPRAALVAKYLWEHSEGINRIEIFSARSFDHTWVVINREGDIKNPNTWGEKCRIVDAWYKNGIIFKATELKEKMKEIAEFVKLQHEAYHQKFDTEAESIIEGCDLISVANLPSGDIFKALSIQSNAVYVYLPNVNELHYFNKLTNERTKVNLNDDNFKPLNKIIKFRSMLILNKARSLSEIELDLIEKYTGHTHFDEIGKVTCKIEPEYNKYPAEQPIEYYYNLVESYNPLRELANKTYQNSDENNSSEEKLAKFLKHAFSEHQNKSRFFRADIDKLNANKNISEEDKQKLTHESSSKKPNHKH